MTLNMSFNAKRIIWRVHNYLWGLQACKQNGHKWWRGDHHVATQLGLKIQQSEPEKKITIVRWRKPNNQGFKLNTDGASKGSTGLAGAGGIIRDDRGHIVVAFQEFLGIATNTYAEISAVAKGLEIAHNRGLNDIWVEMDSKVGIALIKEKYTGHWKCYALSDLRSCDVGVVELLLFALSKTCFALWLLLLRCYGIIFQTGGRRRAHSCGSVLLLWLLLLLQSTATAAAICDCCCCTLLLLLLQFVWWQQHHDSHSSAAAVVTAAAAQNFLLLRLRFATDAAAADAVLLGGCNPMVLTGKERDFTTMGW
ncbi:UNVERIFIED_CONTAM: hypothetical protein Sangu_0788200 [Sesamum angustifolium]|uniref:RNase H type-1 domain-containing protein n=1 Tax=Sesamum angustifolium TaxID=2727405 RepID=A0AAW2PV84_9LAMI